MSFLRLHNCSVAEPFLQQNCLDFYSRALPIAQRVKCLPAMRETWVQSLGQKDPQRRKWQPAQVLFAWKIPWTEKPGRLQSTGSQKSRTQLNDFTFSLLLNMPWEFRKRKKKRHFVHLNKWSPELCYFTLYQRKNHLTFPLDYYSLLGLLFDDKKAPTVAHVQGA